MKRNQKDAPVRVVSPVFILRARCALPPPPPPLRPPPPPPRARSNGVSFSWITWLVITRRYRRLHVLLVRFLYRSTCHIGQQRRRTCKRGGEWWHGSNGTSGTSGAAANAFGTGGPRKGWHGGSDWRCATRCVPRPSSAPGTHRDRLTHRRQRRLPQSSPAPPFW